MCVKPVFAKGRSDCADALLKLRRWLHPNQSLVVGSEYHMNKTKTSRFKSLPRVATLPLILSTMTVGGSVLADSTNSVVPANIDRAFLENLVSQVNHDAAEIKDLKSQLASKESIADAMPASAAPTYPNLQFHGFADLDYHISSRQGIPNAQGVTYVPGSTQAGNSFFLGEFDLFMQSQLAENLSVLAETVLSSGVDNHAGLDIERLELSWKPSDYFNVDVGRFHTEMGYYNTAYHHGSWFQTAVGRPFFLEYEDSGGLLPVHTVGVSIHGAIPSGGLNLSYFLEVGNGVNFNTAGSNPVQNEIDNNQNKSVNLAFVAKPDWFPGGQFGVGAYHDTLSPQGQPRTDEWIWNAHAVYHSSLWEFMAEGFLTRHKPVGQAEHYTPMFYVQGSRKFGLFTPYARFTYANASSNDQIYSAILNEDGPIYGPSIGLRYDFSTFVALKIQYDYVIQSEYQAANELTLQAAFTF